MYKESAVVMLATNEKAEKCLMLRHNKLTYQPYYLTQEWLKYHNAVSKHLYINSNEEIKEGDWFIDLKDNTIWQNKAKESMRKSIFPECKKIIATTNEYIGYTDIRVSPVKNFCNYPQPSDSFIKKYIEEYNKGNVITKVLVVYEIGKSYSGNSGLEVKQWLKVDSNNCITIKKVEPELYTREEVKILLQKSLLFAFKEGNNHIGSNLPFLRTTMDNWIKQNL